MLGFMNKDENRTFSAYTLAEMLIVLLIISVVLLSLPQATKKLFRVKEVKFYHGRYECYWDGVGSNKKLMSYHVQERAEGLAPIIEGPNVVAGNRCEFKLPQTYPYIMIHAVGGGGSGGRLNAASPTISVNSAYYVYYPGNDTNWSKWFRKFIDTVMGSSAYKSAYHIRDGSLLEKKDYATNMIVRETNLAYRKSGAAGRVASMFFTFLPGTKTIYMYPGKGGLLAGVNQNGSNGEDSLVQIVDQGGSCPHATPSDLSLPCNIVHARGGNGAVVRDAATNAVIQLMSAIQLLGGGKSDFGVSAYTDVKEKNSGFYAVIDSINRLDYMNTHIPKNAGNGGNGESQFVNGSTQGLFIHEFNNYHTKDTSAQDGVKWVSVSRLVDKNIYSNGNVNNCSYVNGGNPNVTVTRSVASHSTACVPYPLTGTPSKYTCSVGDFNRHDFNLACQGTPCATYTFNRSGSSYVLSGTGNKPPYSNPQLQVNNAIPINTTMTVRETISGPIDYISCSTSTGYAYTAENGSGTPCSSLKALDSPGDNTCKAHEGGNGAVVILW